MALVSALRPVSSASHSVRRNTNSLSARFFSSGDLSAAISELAAAAAGWLSAAEIGLSAVAGRMATVEIGLSAVADRMAVIAMGLSAVANLLPPIEIGLSAIANRMSAVAIGLADIAGRIPVVANLAAAFAERFRRFAVRSVPKEERRILPTPCRQAADILEDAVERSCDERIGIPGRTHP
jgi:hypothetical protein